METKANHILVGTFTVIVIALAFGFIYWLARFEETTGEAPIIVVFEEAVTGLTPGGDVLFNGIKVGEVASLTVDPENPGRVRTLVYVQEGTPVKTDTIARLEFQGLTGVAVVQLLGGSPEAERVSGGPEGEIPVIVAKKSQLQTLLDTVSDIAEKGSGLFQRLDRVLGTNEESITRSIANVEDFTGTLAANSDRIDSFLRDASVFAGRLDGMSEGLDQLIKGINSLTGEGGGELMQNIGSTFKRIDTFLAENEAPLKETIQNVQTFSGTLAANSEQFDKFMADAGALAERLNSVSATLESVVARADEILGDDAMGLVQDALSAFARVDAFLAENADPLKESIKNVETFSGTLAANTEQFDKFMTDAGSLAERLNGVSVKLESVVERADTLLGEEGSGLVKDARSAFARIDTFLEQNAESFGQTLANAEKFTTVLAENSDQVGALIGDANQLAQKLNKVGNDIDALVARVSQMVDTDAAGFLEDARAAAATFRQIAADLSGQLDRATQGIERATGRSVREFESFLTEGRRTFRNIQTLIDRMQRNPQRFFSGGSQVPEYRGR